MADINNDGYPDWVYALNREDGRLLFEDSWSTQSAAVLSNGNGTWRVEVFGTFKYHHSVDVFRGPGGQWTVIFDGNDFNAPDTYLLQGGSFVPAPGYPPRAIGTIATYSSVGTENVDRFLTDYSASPASMRLFRWTGSSWAEDSRFEWPSWREITILYGNGVVERNIVRHFQGMEYVSGGFFESCVLRPVPGGPPTLVVQLNAALVTGGTAGRDTISQSQMRPWARLFAFQPTGTKLVDTDLFSEREGPYNANFVWCLDVNRDGYEDVVRHPYHDGARPVVLLNDGGGRLQRLPETKFPAGPNGWSSLLIDSDGDGIRDVLYFPGNGCSGGSCATYQLHRGRRQLR